MERLDINTRQEILLNLNPSDLIKYCSVNKKANKEICVSDTFWRRKLEKDYPQEMAEVRKKGIDVIKNPKEIYIRRFTSVAYKIEKFIPELIDFNFGKRYNEFLSDDYKKKLFEAIYRGYENIKDYDYSQSPNERKDIQEDIMIDEIADFLPSPEGYEITYGQVNDFFSVIMRNFIDEILKESLYDLLKK
jgi:hypothetical protein